MIMKSISLLGSTGSIGTQTLDIARKYHFPVNVLTANKNIVLLEAQAREFKPKLVCVYDENVRTNSGEMFLIPISKLLAGLTAYARRPLMRTRI